MSAVVTVGNFDGVHLGHQALVSRAREEAHAVGAETTAMFFDPHPAALFRPEAMPSLLTTRARRRSLLHSAGATRVDVRAFDAAFARQTPREFAAEVLRRDAEAVGVVVGPDFRFGQGREGDLTSLRALGDELGFAVHEVAPVEHGGAVVSSTRIRERLSEGDVEGARTLLARFHDLEGEVVLGDQRGRTIGFPTANLAIAAELATPADGVYAVFAAVDGRRVHGVANVGVRPTFGAGRSVEVHLFDFEGDLYGHTLPVAFVARLREERRFDGVDALVAQIGRDAAEARVRLAAVAPSMNQGSGGDRPW